MSSVLIITDALCLRDVTEAEIEEIKKAGGPGTEVSLAHSQEEAKALQLERFEVIFGWVDEELFARATSLRWLSVAASGMDGCPLLRTPDSRVLVTSEKGLVGPQLADQAFALLLALTRQVAAAVRTAAVVTLPAASEEEEAEPKHHEVWGRRMELRDRAWELAGLKMLVLGFGGTGRAVAQRAALGFDMRVRALDAVHPMPPGPGVEEVEPLTALPEALAEAEVVVVCCPLTEETRDLFDEARFGLMRPGAILINVSRGEIVEEAALLKALNNKTLAAAGLDVQPTEPLPRSHPLWRMENVVITPHIAGASPQRSRRNVLRFIENLRRFRLGETLEGLVDKRLGY